jgi:hypothetical protein
MEVEETETKKQTSPAVEGKSQLDSAEKDRHKLFEYYDLLLKKSREKLEEETLKANKVRESHLDTIECKRKELLQEIQRESEETKRLQICVNNLTTSKNLKEANEKEEEINQLKVQSMVQQAVIEQHIQTAEENLERDLEYFIKASKSIQQEISNIKKERDAKMNNVVTEERTLSLSKTQVIELLTHLAGLKNKGQIDEVFAHVEGKNLSAEKAIQLLKKIPQKMHLFQAIGIDDVRKVILGEAYHVIEDIAEIFQSKDFNNESLMRVQLEAQKVYEIVNSEKTHVRNLFGKNNIDQDIEMADNVSESAFPTGAAQVSLPAEIKKTKQTDVEVQPKPVVATHKKKSMPKQDLKEADDSSSGNEFVEKMTSMLEKEKQKRLKAKTSTRPFTKLYDERMDNALISKLARDAIAEGKVIDMGAEVDPKSGHVYVYNAESLGKFQSRALVNHDHQKWKTASSKKTEDMTRRYYTSISNPTLMKSINHIPKEDVVLVHYNRKKVAIKKKENDNAEDMSGNDSFYDSGEEMMDVSSNKVTQTFNRAIPISQSTDSTVTSEIAEHMKEAHKTKSLNKASDTVISMPKGNELYIFETKNFNEEQLLLNHISKDGFRWHKDKKVSEVKEYFKKHRFYIMDETAKSSKEFKKNVYVDTKHHIAAVHYIGDETKAKMWKHGNTKKHDRPFIPASSMVETNIREMGHMAPAEVYHKLRLSSNKSIEMLAVIYILRSGLLRLKKSEK